MARKLLRDDQYKRIAGLLPAQPGDPGRKSDNRLFLEAVLNRLEQRSFDKHQYKHRNLIERFFLRIKHFRRIATRYDKLAERFSSFIAIVAVFLWLA